MGEEKISKNIRFQKIIKYNNIGIAVNLFLSTFKLIVGISIRAHAVILDAIDGLLDVLSFLFSTFSAKIGKKKADREHPFGYGRVEYLFTMLITVLIMLFGVRTIVESVETIIHPDEAPDYNFATILIMSVSLALKLIFGGILRKKGRTLNSDALKMSGNECLGDAFMSGAILAAIVVYKVSGVDIEHYLCIGIALLIIIPGAQILRDCFKKIIGTSADPEFLKKIRQMVVSLDGVYNVAGLVVHNYGEEVRVGSLEIEVDENMRAAEIGKISRQIIRNADELGLTITSVGVSGINTVTPEASEIWDRILDVIRSHKNILKAHSFTIDFEEKLISFSIVPKFENPDKNDPQSELIPELHELFPEMTFEIRTVMES